MMSSVGNTAKLACIGQIILGPCTEIVRKILKNEIQPINLTRQVRHKLSSTNIQIKPEQYCIICPRRTQYCGDYSEFDITFLYFILRNFSNITQHVNGWGKEPEQTDRCVSANIERIRLWRNKFAHTSNFSLSDSDFNDQCNDMFNTIKELEGYLGTSTVCQDAVSNIRNCSMDSATIHNIIEQLQLLRKDFEDFSSKKKLQQNIFFK